MAHVKRGTTTHARHKKILKLAKGYRGRSKSCYRIAVERVEKALSNTLIAIAAPRSGISAALWIQRINAGAREHGMTYSRFINGLAKAGIDIDRKVLADLAVREPVAFKAIVTQAQSALAA